MEYDPRRQFGYPVLRINPDVGPEFYDYVGQSLDFVIGDDLEDPTLLRWTLGPCQNEALGSAIRKGQAGYFLSIRCNRTLFHDIVEISDDPTKPCTHPFPFESVNGEVLVQLFILGKQVSEIKSDKINDFFGFKSFGFKPGQILGISPEYKVNQKAEEATSSRKIFRFDVVPDLADGIFRVQTEDQQVVIQVSEQQKKNISKLENQGVAGLSILKATLAVPVYAKLISLWKEDQSRDEAWAQWLNDQLELMDDVLLDDSPYLEAAQQLAENPLGAIHKIVRDLE